MLFSVGFCCICIETYISISFPLSSTHFQVKFHICIFPINQAFIFTNEILCCKAKYEGYVTSPLKFVKDKLWIDKNYYLNVMLLYEAMVSFKLPSINQLDPVCDMSSTQLNQFLPMHFPRPHTLC